MAVALNAGIAMDALVRAAAIELGAIAARGRMGRTARRMTVVAWCAMLATTFATASVGCAVAALWVFVLPAVGPVGAPLIAAGALLLLCLALVATIRGILRRRPAPLSAAAVPDAAIPALLIAEASRLLDENKGAALLAALLAGAVAGDIRRK
jgi:hypothetical protein